MIDLLSVQVDPATDNILLHGLVHELDISADQIFRPGEQPYTPEQDQLTREMFSRSEKKQRIIVGTVRALIRQLDDNEE